MTSTKEMLLRAAKTIMIPGHVYELRALGVPTGGNYTRTYAGWFDDPVKLATEAARLDAQKPDYVSITLNPVNPDLLARTANKMKPLKKGDATTTDADVIARKWLPIDLDPVRPAGISANGDELAAAFELAYQIMDDLTVEGWPEPVFATSGNGCHVVYPIDMSQSPETDLAINNCLKALAHKYDNDAVKIDTSLGNASKILKLWGVMSRKGESTKDRPHRRSEIITAPASIEPTPGALVCSLGNKAPRPEPVQFLRNYGDTEKSLIERAEAYLEKCEPAIAGQGGDRTTFRIACAMVNDFMLDDETAFSLLWSWNQRCTPPWEERQLRDKIKHARNYAKKAAGTLAEQRLERNIQKRRKEDAKKAKLEARRADENLTLRDVYNPAKNTDLGNAERLIEGAAGKIKYSPSRGWYAWEGRYWIPDEASVQRLYHEHVIKKIYKEVENSYTGNDAELTKALTAWARKSENSGVMKSTLSMASSMADVTMTHTDIDKDPWLLCCDNGTVDLRTGEMKDHDPADMITRITSVKYDKSAKCPLWENFLNDIFEDPLLIEYIQLAIGYSLTGDTREQCMFIMHGTGQNGKSVFSNILGAILGGYAMETPPETLMRGRDSSSNQPTNDVARLAGARMVSANETEEGQALAESKIKAMTGDDTIIARFLHKEFFEFRPQFKIWMRTNHKPKIRGTDTGIWRRIHLIPFKVTIPAEKRDPELTKKLMAELPGILNWAIDGCLTWQHVGLKAPPVVMAATDDYRTSQDLIGQFLSETCEVCPNKTSGLVKGKDLYQAYCDWCEEAGERAMPHRVLSIKLSERGFNRRRAFHTGAVIWDGIKLLSENARYEQQENLHGGATHE